MQHGATAYLHRDATRHHARRPCRLCVRMCDACTRVRVGMRVRVRMGCLESAVHLWRLRRRRRRWRLRWCARLEHAHHQPAVGRRVVEWLHAGACSRGRKSRCAARRKTTGVGSWRRDIRRGETTPSFLELSSLCRTRVRRSHGRRRQPSSLVAADPDTKAARVERRECHPLGGRHHHAENCAASRPAALRARRARAVDVAAHPDGRVRESDAAPCQRNLWREPVHPCPGRQH